MPPKTFYEVDKKSYLFGKTDSPEEMVRQWVIFELLSTYGFNINDVKIEVQCKVGSKYFPSDIVIYQEHSPLIVIECKRQEHENQEEALAQATSYANYLNAKFVVYSNGNSWIVKRAIDGNWHSIADIPLKHNIDFGKIIPETLEFIRHIQPIFYWVYQTVPKEKAYSFFECFLDFFGSEIANYDMGIKMNVRLELLKVTESLLCVLGVGKEKSYKLFEENPYKMGKMTDALNYLNAYLDKIGFERAFKIGIIDRYHVVDRYNFNELLGILGDDLKELAKKQKKLSNNEFITLRLASSLAEYLWQAYKAESYVEVTSTVMREIETFVDEVIKLELNSSLPDSLDTVSCENLRICSSEKWEEN